MHMITYLKQHLFSHLAVRNLPYLIVRTKNHCDCCLPNVICLQFRMRWSLKWERSWRRSE